MSGPLSDDPDIAAFQIINRGILEASTLFRDKDGALQDDGKARLINAMGEADAVWIATMCNLPTQGVAFAEQPVAVAQAVRMQDQLAKRQIAILHDIILHRHKGPPQ